MSHPLLERVLLDAMHATRRMQTDAPGLVAAIPPRIADRLERALDVCAVCGGTERIHGCGRPEHAPQCHPYQPLVALPMLDACVGCGHRRESHDFAPPNDCHATPTCDCGPFVPPAREEGARP